MQDAQLYWISFAAIFQAIAAIATLLAVFITVWHFRTLWKPRAKVAIDLSLVGDQYTGVADYISISIVNIGIAKFRIKTIDYSPGFWASVKWFHMTDHTIPYTSEIPITLDSTEAAQYFWKVEDWEKAISKPFCEYYQSSIIFRILWRRSLKLRVHTTTNQHFATRLPRGLQLRLNSRLEAGKEKQYQ